MIVKRCLGMPIELAGANLDQAALEVFREKLYVLDHLHRLHKIMLMAEGLCLDMFARDLLAGLHSTTRVNWGFDGQLTSALSLAMVESKVPGNRASTHFSYRVSADLADGTCENICMCAVESNERVHCSARRLEHGTCYFRGAL